MPGIFGIVAPHSAEVLSATLRTMQQSLLHEGFYTSGTYVCPGQHCGVGWVNLRNGFSDCMPIWNEAKDIALFFHGENFAEGGVTEDLKKRHPIPDDSNASYLVHLYEERGEEFVRGLNGFFHGVIIDLRVGQLVLFNDRFGMQRMYYHEDGEGFIFASEAKALLKARPQSRDIVPESLAQMLTMQCVLENKTLFKDVLLLPGASKWVFRNGVCTKKDRFFDPAAWENQTASRASDYYSKLKGTFQQVLPLYSGTKQEAGLSLTGGLDSRLVLAGFHPAPGTMACYTFGSTFNESVDVRLARKLAAICGQRHHTINLDKAFLGSFPELAEKAVYLSDGCLDAASGAAELYVNGMARQIAPVRITGNYGSEILRSVRAFRHRVPEMTAFADDLLPYLESSRQPFQRAIASHPVTFAAFKQAPWYNFNRLSLEQSQLIVRTPFMDNRLVALAYQAPATAVSDDASCLRLVEKLDPRLARVPTNRGACVGRSQVWTTMVHAYHEFWHKAEHCYDYNMPQGVAMADYLLKPLHLERLFLGREKFCFFRVWYRDELGSFLKEVLLDSECLNAPFVNGKHVESMVIAHTKGYRNHTSAIGMLLTYVLTRKVLLKST
jgi:asparagine synthase (glutamine-hydrolysing)